MYTDWEEMGRPPFKLISGAVLSLCHLKPFTMWTSKLERDLPRLGLPKIVIYSADIY